MYRDIGDYGLIGDMHSVALVSKDGSIDYCSMPHIDSPTVFAALLDDEKGGFFKIQPESEFRSEQCYIKDTNIIKCDFNAAAGKAELFNFMPVKTEELFEEEEHSIHRSVKLVSGEMTFMLELYARPRYAAEVPTIDRANNMFKIKSGSESFTLVTDLDRCEIDSSSEGKLFIRFRLKEGETAYFDFIYGDKSTHEFKDHSLEETKAFWLDWLHNCAAGQCSFFLNIQI